MAWYMLIQVTEMWHTGEFVWVVWLVGVGENKARVTLVLKVRAKAPYPQLYFSYCWWGGTGLDFSVVWLFDWIIKND